MREPRRDACGLLPAANRERLGVALEQSLRGRSRRSRDRCEAEALFEPAQHMTGMRVLKPQLFQSMIDRADADALIANELCRLVEFSF